MSRKELGFVEDALVNLERFIEYKEQELLGK